MAQKQIRLEVLTPDRQVLSTNCDFVVVRSTSGEMGFMADHAPLVAALPPQVVRYQSGTEESALFVSGGFVEVDNNVVSIITPAAELASDIDFERAEQAKERAQARLKQRDNVDITRAQAALARANARLSLRQIHAKSH